MDDRERLIRLVVMIAKEVDEWYRPIAARKLAEMRKQDPDVESALEDKTPPEAAARLLAEITTYIKGADLWWRSNGTQGERQDAYDLPAVVLQAVSVLPDDVVMLIGSWVKSGLAVYHADPREVGRLWVEDVKGTAWRLLIEHGLSAEHHMVRRVPLDTTD